MMDWERFVTACISLLSVFLSQHATANMVHTSPVNRLIYPTLDVSQMATHVEQAIGKSFSNRSIQQSVITIDSRTLNQPYRLQISSSGQLRGQVIINGVSISTLRGTGTTINLTPYLNRYQTTIEVVGNYYPSSASVNLSLRGPDTVVSQQSSGDGVLRRRLILERSSRK